MRLINLTAFVFTGMMFTINSAQGIYLDSLIFDMEPQRDFISISVRNDTNRSNFYSASAFRIDKPGDGNENRVRDNEMEVIWSPLNFTNQAGKVSVFKFFYRGPKDNKERYYRMIFKESPVSLIPYKNREKITDAVPIVNISVILIVRPRKAHIEYVLDSQAGVLDNTGNSFFKVIIQKGCNGDDESSTQFYMLPGESYQSESVRAKNKMFIVALGKYIPVGESCPEKAVLK